MTKAVPDSQGVPEEASLFPRIQQGDDDAFAWAFRTYYPMLCGFANGFVRVADVAEELVQDVFLRLWEQRETIQVRGTLRSYLFGAVRNHALNYLKHERVVQRSERAGPVAATIPALGTFAGNADDALYYEELARAFQAAVNALPEGQRSVIVLRWQYHFSYQEIAAALNLVPKSVETQLGRAIKQIRQRLEHFR